MKEKDEKAFYRAEDLAKKLDVNIMTIYRYIEQGKIEAYKMGRHYRIEKIEFNNFLERAKTK